MKVNSINALNSSASATISTSAPITITNTDESSSINSGALRVIGGVWIEKRLNVNVIISNDSNKRCIFTTSDVGVPPFSIDPTVTIMDSDYDFSLNTLVVQVHIEFTLSELL